MGAIFDFASGDFSISVWVKTTTDDAESVVVGRHRPGVVAVYTAGGTAEIFVDGTPAEDSGTSSPVGATSAVFMVGGITYGDSPTGLFSGLVDDLQLYDHALSGKEIGFLFAHPGVSIADHVFSDGFESGGTTAWSGSAGE